jgi:hypothetical protein
LADEALAAQALFDRRLAGGLAVPLAAFFSYCFWYFLNPSIRTWQCCVTDPCLLNVA